MPKSRLPKLLIDESLSPNVAKALKLVGYESITVPEIFSGRRGVTDPDIISWCTANNAVWIHADDRARKEHGKQIIASGIASLWVYRPGGIMSAMEQLRLLSYILPDFIDKLRTQKKQCLYRVSVFGQSHRPRIRLEGLNVVKGKVVRNIRRK